MEMAVTTGAISRAKLLSNHHYQQNNIQFFTGRMPFLPPNQQCQSTEGKAQCTYPTSLQNISSDKHSVLIRRNILQKSEKLCGTHQSMFSLLWSMLKYMQ